MSILDFEERKKADSNQLKYIILSTEVGTQTQLKFTMCSTIQQQVSFYRYKKGSAISKLGHVLRMKNCLIFACARLPNTKWDFGSSAFCAYGIKKYEKKSNFAFFNINIFFNFLTYFYCNSLLNLPT